MNPVLPPKFHAKAQLPWPDIISPKRWVLGHDIDAIRSGSLPEPGHGALLGHQWEPWQICDWAFEAGWEDVEMLFVACAVCLAESQGFDHAVHVNLNGTIDRGMWQLSSIHHDIPDDVAYDPVKATAAAFKLYVARGSDFSDWVAYLTDIYLHDSYLGKSARGVGNMVGRRMLAQPVKPYAGNEYQHRFAGSILNYEHRLAGAIHHVQLAKKDLGWTAAPVAKVQAVQEDLSRALTASKQLLPNG